MVVPWVKAVLWGSLWRPWGSKKTKRQYGHLNCFLGRCLLSVGCGSSFQFVGVGGGKFPFAQSLVSVCTISGFRLWVISVSSLPAVSFQFAVGQFPVCWGRSFQFVVSCLTYAAFPFAPG